MMKFLDILFVVMIGLVGLLWLAILLTVIKEFMK